MIVDLGRTPRSAIEVCGGRLPFRFGDCLLDVYGMSLALFPPLCFSNFYQGGPNAEKNEWTEAHVFGNMMQTA